LLERILRSAVELLHSASGSLCLVDEQAHTYHKEIDLDAGCETGRPLSLDEGMTGLVVRSRGPVILEQYAQVPRGHLAAGEPRYHRAVIGAPIMLGDQLIGALVVFAGDGQRYGSDDARLLQEFAGHAAIAIANSRVYAMAEERAKQVAVAAERERSMQEVHDTFGRGLATVMLRLQAAQRAAASGSGVADQLAAAQAAVDDALREGRRAVWGTGSLGIGDTRTLDEAIRLELDWAAATANLNTNFRVFGDRGEIAPEVGMQLLRIVQEALTNVAQHARASAVRIGLVFGTDGVAVIVEDDGVGFDVEAVRQRRTGMGLAGLVSRATQVGGRVQLESTPGWGTRIRADLPYRPTAGERDGVSRWRVVIVHELPAMRAGLVQLLDESEPGVQVVAEVCDSHRSVAVFCTFGGGPLRPLLDHDARWVDNPAERAHPEPTLDRGF
jgi:signal transduction histidine kinase